MLQAKKVMRDIIKANEKKLSYMKWVSDRIKGIINIKK